MKATLFFVPPGGGEHNYSLDFELPGVPQPGDYISITRPNEQGTSDFIVRRTWWSLHYPSDATYKVDGDSTHGSVKEINVECEYARAFTSSEGHLRECERYQRHLGNLKEFENSGY